MGLLISCDSNDMRVGTFLTSSIYTRSQLNHLTASIESVRIESWEIELKSFISPLIFAAILVTTDAVVEGELTTADATDTYDFRVILVMDTLREGVRMLYLRGPALYGTMT